MTRREAPNRIAEREALGLRLQVLRTSRRLTQQEVAAELGLNRTTIGAWEMGTSELAALDVPRLADIYKVDVAVILGRAAMPVIKAETET